MSLDVAKMIGKFLVANEIDRANVMGGEFFCHPKWKDIFTVLVSDLKVARLVTNGDWAATGKMANDVTGFLAGFSQVCVSFSNDRWHTNRHIDAASKSCDGAGILYDIECPETATDDSIVPVGRSIFEYGFYSFGRYCANPEKAYGFLIDERGEIYKCQMGLYPYDNVENFVNGGFAARFKEMGIAFRESHIMSCVDCVRLAAKVESKI